MKLIHRNKSRPAQLLDQAKGAVKVVTKEVKAIRKAVKTTTAYKRAKSVATRTPVARRAPIVLAAGGATVVAAKKLRSSNGASQTQQTTSSPPTSATVPG
jgi:hypothetical protein